ncbi:hypothetical protein V6N13_002370 [Hibiscus sabdariffa]|uniref:Uncharacterized protein n=1 Tax=Hibiscus sabdariffa TaxID=183260 RepID=A0ABR2C3C9_9ROSI
MTAAKKTETNEGEMERVPEPEVGLGAGASAAMPEPMRPQTPTITSISEAFETPIAICLLQFSTLVLFLFYLKVCGVEVEVG